jgi:large subunit ribosomal protein L5
MMVPRLTKIVVNMGVGKAVENKNRIEAANKDLTAITGQKPVDPQGPRRCLRVQAT